MMSIPELKKIKSEKKYHNTTLKDDYSWVDQPDILDVLKNPEKLHPEVKKYIEENIKSEKRLKSIIFLIMNSLYINY